MIDDRDDVVAWLDGLAAHRPARGIDALVAARELVDQLGHPQRTAPAVHIVGTAGKGTLAAQLTARLRASGLTVATHQSPHVDDVRERFLVDGGLVDWATVVDAARSVAAAHSRMERPLSFFAATAALSWEIGAMVGADVFVTEAGIGGRVDATAVLDRLDTLTVLTAVGLDHIDVLGPTVEVITAEKVAVVAGRSHLVIGPQVSPVVAPLARAAAIAAGADVVEVAGSAGDAGSADFRVLAARTADRVGEVLASLHGWHIGPEVEVALAGRAEEWPWRGRRVMLDGAHNPLKLRALATLLDRDRPACVVAAVGAGKDLDGCAAGLVALGAPIVVVEFATVGPASWPASVVVDAVRAAGGDATVLAIEDAPAHLAHVTREGERIVVTGSFLHLAAVRVALSSG